ncbi:MAG: Uma2 family endonuclease [Pseudonocardia sp.]|nr:Uma2 family endonuclease [Pseudonocardia sp.]
MTVQTASIPRITADEFLSGDYPEGSELIDGVVYEVDPAFDHQEVGARLLDEIRAWVRAEPGRGRAGYGGNWVLSDGHVYKPDVWWKAQRPRGVRNDGPPELAIEVRSPGTWALDIGPKLRRYEASGAVEVWLVDTPSSTVLIFRRGDSGPGFADVVEIGLGTVLGSPLLPGFELKVDELFADLG